MSRAGMHDATTERVENTRSEINPLRLDHPVLAFLKAYWESKRQGRVMPARADMDPIDLKAHLGWIVLVDVLPALADFRFRLIGTLVTEYFLRDSTRKTVSECFEHLPTVRKGMLAAFRKVARDRVVLRVFGDAGWIGKGYLGFDALLLPLSEDGASVNMVMCAFTFDARQQLLRRYTSLH